VLCSELSPVSRLASEGLGHDPMTQRVSRGFHRLGLFLAASPLFAGLAWSAYFVLAAWRSSPFSWYDFWAESPFDQILMFIVGPVAVAVAVALAVYGVVRAVGWVIGGFAAS
jgi:type IV secretory pathway VirB2 component (pilin)